MKPRFLASIAKKIVARKAFPFNQPFAVVVLSAGFLHLTDSKMI